MGAEQSKALFLYVTRDMIWAANSVTRFTLHIGQNQETKAPASVFIYEQPLDSTEKGISPSMFLSNAVQKLKTIRHPGIIKFLASHVSERGRIRVVTEPVIPLIQALAKLSSDQICMGIYSLLKTVNFLHSEKICHNNLCMNSVFVSIPDYRFVLGGMEFVSNFDETDFNWTSQIHPYLSDDIIPPEDEDDTLSNLPIQSRDIYALGQLLSEIILPLSSTLGPDSAKWQGFQHIIDGMTEQFPSNRTTADQVLSNSFFKDNVALNIVDFIKEIRTIPPEVKRHLFGQLPNKLRCLPEPTLRDIILPMILNPDLFSEPGAEAFYHSLFCRPKLQDSPSLTSHDLYNNNVLPFIMKMWGIRNYDIRAMMLVTVDEYAEQLLIQYSNVLEKLLVPETILGLQETDDLIYSGSVCSLATLLPLLCSVHSSAHQVYLGPKDVPSYVKNTVPMIGSPEISMVPVAIARTKGMKPATSTDSLDKEFLEGPQGQVPSRSESMASLSGPILPETGRKINAVRWTVDVLVEKLLVPNALHVAVSNLSDPYKKSVIESMSKCWRRMHEELYNAKGALFKELKIATQLMQRYFALILKVSSPELKLYVYTDLIVRNYSADPKSKYWLAKAIDLGIPLLRDASKIVRNKVSTEVIAMISFITANMDSKPSVTRVRDQHGAVFHELENAFGHLIRPKNRFVKAGLSKYLVNTRRGSDDSSPNLLPTLSEFRSFYQDSPTFAEDKSPSPEYLVAQSAALSSNEPYDLPALRQLSTQISAASSPNSKNYAFEASDNRKSFLTMEASGNNIPRSFNLVSARSRAGSVDISDATLTGWSSPKL